MMASLAQNFQPGGIQQHPGAPQGHPMGVPHNPNQQLQGPGMPQQMHMGVSGPGPQVSQPGAMMGGMPQGVGGPSAHALQHLNPGQAAAAAQQHMFQQQQLFANPQLQQQMQQHQLIQQQRQAQARQQMLQQQYSGGMSQGIPNGMNPMQFQAMRAGGPMARPVNVNLPQHLQQQQQIAQQQAQHGIEQQQQAQAQAQHQHQQQMLAAQQQMAMQQQQQANAQAQGGGNHPQQNMNAQQLHNMQQAQMLAAQQQHHQQQQQQQAAANAQNQPQPQPQSQPQQLQASQQALVQQQAQGQQPNNMQVQQAAAAAMLQQQQQQQQQQRHGDRGQCLLQLMTFADHLSNFRGSKQGDDISYWFDFVNKFFSPNGVFRHTVKILDDNTNKQYEISFPAIARYFHTHFESGVKTMQMIMERGQEKPLPNNQHYVESPKTSFVYWFDNGSQLIANGTLKAHFDANQKIESFEFVTTGHEEFIPRTKFIEAARPIHEWTKEWKHLNSSDGKASPELNKKKQKPIKSPAQPPPEIDLGSGTKVKNSMGITHSVFQFLEFVEVLGQMNPLFGYSHKHQDLGPYAALESYVSTVVNNGSNLAGASPALGQLNLPSASPLPTDNSPMQAPSMLPQHSQQTHSSSNSVQTSPAQSNKRRRPSGVNVGNIKNEDENGIANGAPPKSANSVKASPRVGGKRQKGNPA